MASLPSLTLPGVRRAARSDARDDARAKPTTDPQARAGRRLRERDLARRTTSVAPPSGRR
jgi:hypothetical protein